MLVNGEQKNESFKLLQLSDDSKSLSDLELPELLSQRKRKVRRKTRPRTSSYRGDDDRDHGTTSSGHLDCRNFGLWLAILMTVLWLFIISYITSVVHSENRRLELALQKVSATSQNVPEALQKWHETSRNLEQNQTALNGKLRDIQQVLSNFSTELKQFHETIEKKNENSQETHLKHLQSSVADLGSKIDDAMLRVVALEDEFRIAQSQQKAVNKTIDFLQTQLNRNQNASSPATIADSNLTEKSIADIRELLAGQITSLALNFTEELQTLKQKNSWLDKDLANNKKSIDDLTANSANISSHVSSVEKVWVEIRSNLTVLESDAKEVYDQVVVLANATAGLRSMIGTVQEECVRYHSQNDDIAGELGTLKDRLQQMETKVLYHGTESNTTQNRQDGLPNRLSQLFAEGQTETMTAKPSTGTAKTSTTVSDVAAANVDNAGTLVTQVPTAPQPVASSVSKKSAASYSPGM